MLYIREDTPSRLLTEYKPAENVECLFVEINIRRKKWLLCCSYNPHKNNISNHLHHLEKVLDVYLKHYDNLLILGDLNSDLKDDCLNSFSNVNNLKSLNKEPTCFKSPNNPSCIDLFLTNSSRYFQNTSIIETGISDFHKLVVKVLKMFYKKQRLKTIQNRNYKTFNEHLFRIELKKELAKRDLNKAELAEFHNEFLSVLNKQAAIKYKYIRDNNSSYMTKSLRKEIVLRSRLHNKFLKTKTEESKQQNLCVTLLRMSKEISLLS